jgi:hypothetical protein
MPDTLSLPCPACRIGLAPAAFAMDAPMLCPSCRVPLEGVIFPAFWREDESAAGRALPAGEAEAACFFHPENRAALSCERCGRFICTVCDLPIGSRHLCPSCVSAGLTGEKLPEIVPRRFLWGEAALYFGTIPLLLAIGLWPFLIVTGLIAIFLALWGWRRPGSIPRGARRWPAIVGIIGGLLQIAAWLGMTVLITNGLRHR